MSSQPQFIPIYEPTDAQAGGITSDSVNTGKLNMLHVVIQLGAITGDGATFQFYAGATAGAETTEIFPQYRKSGADYGVAGADVFGARTTVPSGGIDLTAATAWDHRTIDVEIFPDRMPEGKPWLTVQLEDGAASVEVVSILGVGEARNSGDTNPTAL